jgi:hypothetical protein
VWHAISGGGTTKHALRHAKSRDELSYSQRSGALGLDNVSESVCD